MFSETKQTYETRLLSNSPRLYYLVGFLNDAECRHLIDEAGSRISRSSTVDPDTGELIYVDARTSSSTYFERGQTEGVTAIEQRISGMVQMPVENGEGLQLLHYGIGQGYEPHFDFFDPALKGSPAVLAYGGQRHLTVIMYLNDIEQGGETVFPEIDVKIAPKKGDAILFYNCFADGQIDRMSLHGSLPVIAGEKWVATKWVRTNEYKAPE